MFLFQRRWKYLPDYYENIIVIKAKKIYAYFGSVGNILFGFFFPQQERIYKNLLWQKELKLS